MARQSGERPIRGTYGGICFYQMEGHYYARMKSNLTGKRVKRDPKFKRTMQLAGIFGIASKIASAVYKTLPEKERGRDVRYELIRRARKMLEDGMSEELVVAVLSQGKDRVMEGAVILKKVFDKRDEAEHAEKAAVLYTIDTPVPVVQLE